MQLFSFHISIIFNAMITMSLPELVFFNKYKDIIIVIY